MDGFHSDAQPGAPAPLAADFQLQPDATPPPTCRLPQAEAPRDYIAKVKAQFTEQHAMYYQFLKIMREFKEDIIDTAEVLRCISNLFYGHRCLILGFNTFLSPVDKIEIRDDPKNDCDIASFSAPRGNFSTLSLGLNAATATIHRANSTKLAVISPGAQPRQGAPTDAGKAIEFDQEVKYVSKIKGRFSADEAVFKRFLATC